MKCEAIDTNVILRFLIEGPSTIAPQFRGVYSFFSKLQEGKIQAELLELVLFQSYFVLTSFYKVPRSEAAEKLAGLVRFRGLRMQDKDTVLACLDTLLTKNIDIVDAYILAWSAQRGLDGVYSFDNDLRKLGMKPRKVT